MVQVSSPVRYHQNKYKDAIIISRAYSFTRFRVNLYGFADTFVGQKEASLYTTI